mmetsp:Transcript_23626/g.35447  ORF Transcript_23626/g.35447 Transcript_23626/m.35447 type:complete len:431 (+) Transcript_23626:62-1354(+)|eukprot:CAMPEP_0167753842 /NCGR_PEP_ID=MMETSP0110_2-20121227/7939_1 /TAXON_ID=629695 /ORGANISM="Gymnochlora sp., Strain CCMP2014" /LENGTH=430 /DNA_ID=CAMNT_0007639655 /DNA_START=59 /DNA_END=1351 /DNA_ORIENTATION=+
MGNCACHSESENFAFGEKEMDMEAKTTKSTMKRRASLSIKRSKKKASKKSMIVLNQEIYPTGSSDKGLPTECIWTQSYDEAIKAFSHEELEQVREQFKQASVETNGTKKETKAPSPPVIGLDEFIKYFSGCFGVVGHMMSTQLFTHLTNTMKRCGCGVAKIKNRLELKPLISAIYTWQRGTMRDKLILLFDMWDTDPQDGYLSRKELKNMVRAMSRRHAAPTVMMLEALHLDMSPVEAKDEKSEVEEFSNRELAKTAKGMVSLSAAELADLKDRTRKERCARSRSNGVPKEAIEDVEPRGVDVNQNTIENRKAEEKSQVKSSGVLNEPVENGEAKSESAHKVTTDNKKEITFKAQKESEGKRDNYELYHRQSERQCYGSIDDELEFFIDQVFEFMDTQHDGLVSTDEWLRFASGDKNLDDFLEHLILSAV